MAQATWTWGLADDTGSIIDFIDCPAGEDGNGVRYTRRRNGYCEMEGMVVNPDDLRGLDPYSTFVVAWRNGTCRFQGRVVDPFRRTPAARHFLAKDDYHNMSWRRVRTKKVYSGVETDAIGSDLIDLQNGYRYSGLEWGDPISCPGVNLTTHPGDTVSERVEWLADVPDSYDFRINAVDPATGGTLRNRVHAFTGHTDQTDACFGFGTRTWDNLLDYSFEVGQITNRKSLIAKHGKVYTRKNDTSIADHGLWEDERGHVLTAETDTLGDIAGNQLKTMQDVTTLTVKPADDAPTLYSDYDVADYVHVWLSDYGFVRRKKCRVEEVQLLIEADSSKETTDVLSLTVVGDD